TAALMSENKHLANPCVTDSTPTSANQEDHVSMAAHGAFRLMRMAENLSVIQGIEALCAAQGIEARAPLQSSAALVATVRELRKRVSKLKEDRMLAPDIEAIAAMVRSGDLLQAAL
ncbi:MAG: aromatic amino acid lyase, partial [Paracoccaceae bacterium]